MNAAIYTRVSTADQAEHGSSPEVQRERCRKFVEQQGWTLFGVFEDVISGAKKDRPGLGRLVGEVVAGRVDVIVSLFVDRIGRDELHSHELYAILDAAKVALWTPDGAKYDADTSASQLSRSIQTAVAADTRRRIAERSKIANAKKAQDGSYNGGPIPFGYERGAAGGLAPNEDDAKWIRHIFNRYVHDGASFYAIAKELKAAKISTPRGGDWSGHAVADRIKMSIYAGVVSGGAQGRHEPLIDLDTFQRAQARHAAVRTLNGNGRGRKPTVHLLGQGMLQCECGRSLRPITEASSGTRYYRCRRKNEEGAASCAIPNLPQAVVDEAMLAYLSEHVISPGVTEGELEAQTRRAAAEAKKVKAAATSARKRAVRRRESAEDKWIDGKIDDARWAELKARFDQEADQADADVAEAESTLDALARPDDEARVAVMRLREDIRAAADNPALIVPLIVKLYERIEVVAADREIPPAPTKGHRPKANGKAPTKAQLAAVAKAQAAELDGFTFPSFVHAGKSYGLVPVLRPELAAIYGDSPLIGAADQIAGNGRPFAGTVLVARLAMGPP